jgi:hypothetical protein
VDDRAPRYRGKPIVVCGRSLGTGLAVKLPLIDPQFSSWCHRIQPRRCGEGSVSDRAGMAARVRSEPT